MRWFHLIFHWISSTFVALCAALARPFKAGSPTVPILPVVSQAVPTTPSFIQHYEPTFPEDPMKFFEFSYGQRSNITRDHLAQMEEGKNPPRRAERADPRLSAPTEPSPPLTILTVVMDDLRCSDRPDSPSVYSSPPSSPATSLRTPDIGISDPSSGNLYPEKNITDSEHITNTLIISSPAFHPNLHDLAKRFKSRGPTASAEFPRDPSFIAPPPATPATPTSHKPKNDHHVYLPHSPTSVVSAAAELMQSTPRSRISSIHLASRIASTDLQEAFSAASPFSIFADSFFLDDHLGQSITKFDLDDIHVYTNPRPSPLVPSEPSKFRNRKTTTMDLGITIGSQTLSEIPHDAVFGVSRFSHVRASERDVKSRQIESYISFTDSPVFVRESLHAVDDNAADVPGHPTRAGSLVKSRSCLGSPFSSGYTFLPPAEATNEDIENLDINATNIASLSDRKDPRVSVPESFIVDIEAVRLNDSAPPSDTGDSEPRGDTVNSTYGPSDIDLTEPCAFEAPRPCLVEDLGVSEILRPIAIEPELQPPVMQKDPTGDTFLRAGSSSQPVCRDELFPTLPSVPHTSYNRQKNRAVKVFGRPLMLIAVSPSATAAPLVSEDQVSWVDFDDSPDPSPISEGSSMFGNPSEPFSPANDDSSHIGTDEPPQALDINVYHGKTSVRLDHLEEGLVSVLRSRRAGVYGILPLVTSESDETLASRKMALRASAVYSQFPAAKRVSSLRPLVLPARVAVRERSSTVSITKVAYGDGLRGATQSADRPSLNRSTIGPPPPFPLPGLPTMDRPTWRQQPVQTLDSFETLETTEAKAGAIDRLDGLLEIFDAMGFSRGSEPQFTSPVTSSHTSTPLTDASWDQDLASGETVNWGIAL